MSVMETAVPLSKEDAPHNRAYRKAVHEARTALAAADSAILPEAAWRKVEEVLAGAVPDFGRHLGRKERAEIIKAVIAAVKTAQTALVALVEAWRKQQRPAITRRTEAQEMREVLRTILLAWREEADPRRARCAAVHTAADRRSTGTRWLSGQADTYKEAHPLGEAGGWDETHHFNGAGQWVLGPDPLDTAARNDFARVMDTAAVRAMRQGSRNSPSAVPAGSAARLLLTWARLTGGPYAARKAKDSKAIMGQPPGKDRRHETAELREEAATEGGAPVAWPVTHLCRNARRK